VNINEQTPIWISVKDMNHYFSIGKTRTYELINAKDIESRSDTKRGGKQGKRLIRFQSVADYIEELPEGSTEQLSLAVPIL
jgi:hypothetical protein